MAPIDLTIIVVSYNTRALTLRCLRSVFERTRGPAFELLVVDNASTDGSADAIARDFPQVRLMRSETNLGFARANNLAARAARGAYLLLLNPDTWILDDAIGTLLAFARAKAHAGIFGGRTLFADLTLNPTSCWGRPTPWSALCRGLGLSAVFRGSRWFDPEALGGWKRDSVREVDIVTGCFLLLARDLWRELGGFDPTFHMYGEDADLCLRARRRGRPCLICPDAAIVHLGGASEPVRSAKMVRLFRAKAQLFERHWSAAAARFGAVTLDLWALTRLATFAAARLVRPARRASYQTWREIWQNRAEWHTTRPAAPHACPGRSLNQGTP